MDNNMNPAGIRSITKESDEKLYKRISKLRDWVTYLEEQYMPTMTEDEIKNWQKWTKNKIRKKTYA